MTFISKLSGNAYNFAKKQKGASSKKTQNYSSLFGNNSQFNVSNSTNNKNAKIEKFTDFYNKFLQEYENNPKLKNDKQASDDNNDKNIVEDEYKDNYSSDMVNGGDGGVFEKEDSDMLLEDGTVAPFNAIIEDGKIIGYESFGDE